MFTPDLCMEWWPFTVFFSTVVNDITRTDRQKRVQNKNELLLNSVEAMKMVFGNNAREKCPSELPQKEDAKIF